MVLHSSVRTFRLFCSASQLHLCACFGFYFTPYKLSSSSHVTLKWGLAKTWLGLLINWSHFFFLLLLLLLVLFFFLKKTKKKNIVSFFIMISRRNTNWFVKLAEFVHSSLNSQLSTLVKRANNNNNNNNITNTLYFTKCSNCQGHSFYYF